MQRYLKHPVNLSFMLKIKSRKIPLPAFITKVILI